VIARKAWLAGLAALLVLSCGLLSPAPTAIPTALPTSPPDALQVDYVYTSNLITIIYPLYGSTLDDFVVVTITNPRDTPAQLIVESEVTGYTTKSIDTVPVGTGETLEVRQNPRLIPKMIDQLNAQKPAQFHIRMAELDNGEEKMILEETGDTLVYARRDFPWSIPGFTDDEIFELLAAMATPHDPAVEELVRNAANYTSSGIIWSGYGGNVNDEGGGVWDRLQAIWRRRKITTSPTSAPGFPSHRAASSASACPLKHWNSTAETASKPPCCSPPPPKPWTWK